MKATRNPESAPGDWYVDTACIDCGASRHVAPNLIAGRNGKSVFIRQPASPEERLAAWRAALVCPTASVRSEVKQPEPPATIFPQEMTDDVWRCGFNARSSFGAHSYFVARPGSNLLVDSPRYTTSLVKWFEAAGGIADILLTHNDDVADADKYAKRFSTRVWIHQDDRSAAPYATDLLFGESARTIGSGVVAIPVPGHTRGSVAYLFDDQGALHRRLPCMEQARAGPRCLPERVLVFVGQAHRIPREARRLPFCMGIAWPWVACTPGTRRDDCTVARACSEDARRLTRPRRFSVNVDHRNVQR